MTVPITIEGKTYRLGYDFNKICQVELESGGNLLDGLLNPGGMTAHQLRGLLCAAIRAGTPATKKRPPITVSQVAALTSYENIIPLSEALSKSILLSIARPVDAAPAAPKTLDDTAAAETDEDEPETPERECL